MSAKKTVHYLLMKYLMLTVLNLSNQVAAGRQDVAFIILLR